MVRRAVVAALLAVTCGSAHAAPARVLWSASRDLSGNADSAVDVAVDPAGIAVAVGNLEAPGEETVFAVRAHDAATGDLLWEDLPELGAEAGANAVAVRHGVAVAVGWVGNLGSRDFVVRAYDVTSGALLWSEVLDVGATDVAWGVAIRGRRAVVAGTVDGAFAVRAYDTRSGALLWQDTGGAGGAGAVAIRGRRVVAAGTEVRGYDLVTGALQWAHADPEESLGAVAMRSRLTVAVGYRWTNHDEVDHEHLDFLVRTYDSHTGAPVWSEVYDHAGEVDQANDVAVHGRVAVAVGSVQTSPYYDEQLVRAYDVKTGEVLWSDVVSPPDHDAVARGVAIKSGTVVVAGSLVSTSAVRAYDKRTGALLWEHDDPLISGHARAVDVVPGRPLAVVAGGGTFFADPPNNWDFSVRAYHLRGRRTPAPTRFVDQGDGTILDRGTGLRWEKKAASGSGLQAADSTFTWCADVAPQDFSCDDPALPSDGTAYTAFLPNLNGIELGGFDDWRVPTFTELSSIGLCDYGTGAGGGACLDPAFGLVGSGWYWSSTALGGGGVGLVEFDFGYSSSGSPAALHHVRGVRGTPTEPTG